MDESGARVHASRPMPMSWKSRFAGVIGKRRFLDGLWGDTVNMAIRMESHGSPGKGKVETRHLVGPSGRRAR